LSAKQRKITSSFGLVLRRCLIAACIGAAMVSAQTLKFTPLNKDIVLERVKEPPVADAQRADAIKTLFLEAGCNGNNLREQKTSSAAPNIVCELPGESGATIVVGAHYEHSSSSRRPFDNWSGAALLPALYQSLHSGKRHHTILFVAFADQGNELSGAETFAEHMNAEKRRRTEAIVNLDVLGLSPTKVWASHSDKKLVHELIVMVYSLKLPASQIDMETAGPSDAEVFAPLHIPRITIHSLTQQNLDGTVTGFRPDNYYDTYRLLCGYLAYLDATLKPRSHSE